MYEHPESAPVLVSPRHLAGAGLAQINEALTPLVKGFDWPHQRTASRIDVTSPCGSVQATFEPSRPDGRWWTVQDHQADWTAQFTGQTPVEAVTALLQALPNTLGDTRHAHRIETVTGTPSEIASAAGWSPATEAEATTYTSPDSHCRVTHQPGSDVPWRVEHSVYDGFDTHWTGTFTRNTPDQLVSQFLANLSSSAPVERLRHEIPYMALHSGDALITPAAGTTPSPHLHHAVAEVVQAHTSHRPGR
ncbi:DUF317 domain-containing protein [Streptomyces albidoflavus]|uniref:DUF317 domain-containing protein n=1 Tax=Streptomyces albidoflavus TaxID=1886 RepID=UPI00101E305D|nr:DUF317 domain-containing protein [Streptomyces albidoflavus]RZD82177.1 hypothetical protein C0Q63_22260 [Streptomyces albidoflavus]RZD89351.1 hypothetical protein C0Q60_03895 [Streptomyces albidoflavus]RZE05010.1 hypothetical protein C0Q62_03810 [Streptomyces albidoflavus]